MMLPKKSHIRFAIVGCGAIAKRHAEHITNLATLAAVCDTKTERADHFAKTFGATAYYAIDDMLNAAELPDVVAICTPNGLHAEHAIKALRAGCHVVCEKPMALSVADCETMITEARRAGKELFIVKQNRFNPPVAAVKELIRSGKLGKILGVQVNCFWNRGEAYYKSSDWRGTKSLDGGVLYTQFSHFVDLLHWLVGGISDVEAYVGNSNHPYIEIEDHGAVIFRLNDGAVGTLKYTVNAHQKNMEGSVTIFGEKGTIKIGGEYLNTLEYALVEDYQLPELPKGNTANDYGTYRGSMSNHDKVYENVIAVLTENAPIAATGDDGWRTVETISRIYQAAGWR